jgi:hypothetical protein
VFAGLHTAGADLDSSTAGKRCPLEIGVFSDLSGRVKFGSSNTVGVSSRYE